MDLYSALLAAVGSLAATVGVLFMTLRRSWERRDTEAELLRKDLTSLIRDLIEIVESQTEVSHDLTKVLEYLKERIK